MRATAELLDEGSVVAYLNERGVVSSPRAAVRTLGGGVSNTVLEVSDGGRRVVVKQALPRLRVASEWLAKQERALTEADALRLAGTFTPDVVPRVLDVDPERCAVTIEAAPAHWVTWKEALMAGDAEASVAARLGGVLATWHERTAAQADALGRFDDQDAFVQLRVDPYHHTVAARHPDVAPAVAEVVTAMAGLRRCLVHGDFSPKNVLLGHDGLWVIDFEVAHLGDPAFDVAFLLSHLLLKAVHLPEDRAAYAACADRFLAAYRAGVPAGFAGPPAHLVAHLGCLLLARVDGKSPAEYLTDGQRRTVRTLALAVLTDPPGDVADVWGLLP